MAQKQAPTSARRPFVAADGEGGPTSSQYSRGREYGRVFDSPGLTAMRARHALPTLLGTRITSRRRRVTHTPPLVGCINLVNDARLHSTRPNLARARPPRKLAVFVPARRARTMDGRRPRRVRWRGSLLDRRHETDMRERGFRRIGTRTSNRRAGRRSSTTDSRQRRAHVRSRSAVVAVAGPIFGGRASQALRTTKNLRALRDDRCLVAAGLLMVRRGGRMMVQESHVLKRARRFGAAIRLVVERIGGLGRAVEKANRRLGHRLRWRSDPVPPGPTNDRAAVETSVQPDSPFRRTCQRRGTA